MIFRYHGTLIFKSVNIKGWKTHVLEFQIQLRHSNCMFHRTWSVNHSSVRLEFFPLCGILVFLWKEISSPVWPPILQKEWYVSFIEQCGSFIFVEKKLEKGWITRFVNRGRPRYDQDGPRGCKIDRARPW